MLRNQLFGVEIEMTGITRIKAAEIVGRMLHSTASNPTGGCYHTQIIVDNKNRKWKIMRDGSIRPTINIRTSSRADDYSVELVTPPLNYEDIELLQEVVRALRAGGAKVNGSCGIHIHVDGANHTATSLKNLVSFMTARQSLINQTLGNESRSNWCKELDKRILRNIQRNHADSQDQIERIWYSRANDNYSGGISHEHYNETRYHGLNLHSYFSKGTVEFRLFNSTLHAGKIKAYIQLVLAISAWAISTSGRVTFKSIDSYTPEQKVNIMRNILINRLGLSGNEFKTCRYHLMKPLKDAAGMPTRYVA